MLCRNDSEMLPPPDPDRARRAILNIERMIQTERPGEPVNIDTLIDMLEDVHKKHPDGVGINSKGE